MLSLRYQACEMILSYLSESQRYANIFENKDSGHN